MFHQTPHYEPFSLKNVFNRFLHQKSALNKLIIINVAVYLCFLTFKIFFTTGAFLFDNNSDKLINQWIISKLSCPASLSVLLTQPWSIISNTFFHVEFWHIFFNMIMLWVSGRIFLQYLNEKQLVTTYLIGGICGNLFYMSAYNFFPVFAADVQMAMCLGASGSIMAILGAITIYKPEHELLFSLLPGRGFSIKLKWLTAIFLIIDLISIPKGNAGGHIAHLGGALYGALYTFLLSKHIFASRPKQTKRKKHFYSSYNTPSQGRVISDEEYNFNKKKMEEKLDQILDKISSSGYDALTKEEKDFLFFSSKRKKHD